jgi:hypothetical protein
MERIDQAILNAEVEGVNLRPGSLRTLGKPKRSGALAKPAKTAKMVAAFPVETEEPGG